MNTSASRILRQVTLHLALAAGALVMIWPFVIMISTALTPERDVFSGGSNWGNLTLDNLRSAWAEASWMKYYLNGAVVSIMTLAGQLIVCLPAGYALAKTRLPGRGLMLWIVLAALAIPAQVIAIPVYVMFARVGLLDSLPSLVLPFIGSAYGIFLFRQFAMSIPQSILDAARVDGVGRVAILWRVVVPNVRPAIATFSILSIVSHWNDLFWPSVMLRSDRYATVPFAITRFASEEAGTRYAVQMAAAFLALAPIIALFALAQRYLVKGISFAGTNE